MKDFVNVKMTRASLDAKEHRSTPFDDSKPASNGNPSVPSGSVVRTFNDRTRAFELPNFDGRDFPLLYKNKLLLNPNTFVEERNGKLLSKKWLDAKRVYSISFANFNKSGQNTTNFSDFAQGDPLAELVHLFCRDHDYLKGFTVRTIDNGYDDEDDYQDSEEGKERKAD